MNTQNQSLDLGNNESAVTGVYPQPDGTWTALTFTRSRSGFKTEAGARRWFHRATGRVAS